MTEEAEIGGTGLTVYNINPGATCPLAIWRCLSSAISINYPPHTFDVQLQECSSTQIEAAALCLVSTERRVMRNYLASQIRWLVRPKNGPLAQHKGI